MLCLLFHVLVHCNADKYSDAGTMQASTRLRDGLFLCSGWQICDDLVSAQKSPNSSARRWRQTLCSGPQSRGLWCGASSVCWPWTSRLQPHHFLRRKQSLQEGEYEGHSALVVCWTYLAPGSTESFESTPEPLQISYQREHRRTPRVLSQTSGGVVRPSLQDTRSMREPSVVSGSCSPPPLPPLPPLAWFPAWSPPEQSEQRCPVCPCWWGRRGSWTGCRCGSECSRGTSEYRPASVAWRGPL